MKQNESIYFKSNRQKLIFFSVLSLVLVVLLSFIYVEWTKLDEQTIQEEAIFENNSSENIIEQTKNQATQIANDSNKIYNPEESNDPIFFVVEEMPQFPGGYDALRKFIATSIRIPQASAQNGIQGKVYVQFVINAKGEVTNIKIARGVDPLLDQEAIRVIQIMPDWIPGKQLGKPVRVSYTIPISFVL